MIPEWLIPYMPAITGLLGMGLSWVLSNSEVVKEWFTGQSRAGKLGVIAALALAYGVALHFGLGADIVDAIYSVLILFGGSQVGYVALVSKGGK